MDRVLSASMAAALIAGGAWAQDVATSPGDHVGSPGRTIEFAFGFEGDGRLVSSVAFDIPYDPPSAPYEPVADASGVVDCTVEADANADPGLVFFNPSAGLFAVTMGDLTPPLINPIGRDGIITRCRVRIKTDAAFGTHVLECRNGDASSAMGQPLATQCSAGSLTVREPSCIGDQDFDGTVVTDEVTRSVLAFVRRDPSPNPFADGDNDGMVSSAEVTRSVLNFTRRQCTQ